MTEQELVKMVVEQYARTGVVKDIRVNIVRIADVKSTFVEPNVEGGGGRSVTLYEFRVDGKTYWAGYSIRSQTVYISFW